MQYNASRLNFTHPVRNFRRLRSLLASCKVRESSWDFRESGSDSTQVKNRLQLPTERVIFPRPEPNSRNFPRPDPNSTNVPRSDPNSTLLVCSPPLLSALHELSVKSGAPLRGAADLLCALSAAPLLCALSAAPLLFCATRSEVRGPRSEVRGPRSEVGGRRSEVRGRRSEVRIPLSLT